MVDVPATGLGLDDGYRLLRANLARTARVMREHERRKWLTDDQADIQRLARVLSCQPAGTIQHHKGARSAQHQPTCALKRDHLFRKLHVHSLVDRQQACGRRGRQNLAVVLFRPALGPHSAEEKGSQQQALQTQKRPFANGRADIGKGPPHVDQAVQALVA